MLKGSVNRSWTSFVPRADVQDNTIAIQTSFRYVRHPMRFRKKYFNMHFGKEEFSTRNQGSWARSEVALRRVLSKSVYNQRRKRNGLIRVSV